MSDQKTKYIGRKVLYVTVITLSVLLILFITLGLNGKWEDQRPLTEAVVTKLVLVEENEILGQQNTAKEYGDI